MNRLANPRFPGSFGRAPRGGRWFPLQAVFLAACATSVPGVTQTFTRIDTLEISRHARILSADSLLGRGIGTPQLDVAGRYIASVCSDIGLSPLGAEYQLVVPLTKTTFVQATYLEVVVDGRPRRFPFGNDFFINLTTASNLSFDDRAVLVGSDEQIRVTDVDDPLAGAIAVTLGTVSPQASHNLSERGATAMVHLVSDTAAYRELRDPRGTTRIVAADQHFVSSLATTLPSIIVAPPLSQQLYAALTGNARVSMALRVVTSEERFVSHNVGCLARGSAAANRRGIIAFTAHYDHLGVGEGHSPGDSIYNGFSDNAAGVGMLLAIAHVAAREPRVFKNDVVLLFFTAEEIGLIGSDYFVMRPPVPLERFRAVINLDAGAPPAPPWSWRIAGGNQSDLGRLAVDVALSRGWSATTSAAVPNSDYFPFWRRGVPAIFIVPGVETFEGMSADSSRALRARWDRYHQTDDEYDPEFPFSGLQRYAEYALLIALRVDAESLVN